MKPAQCLEAMENAAPILRRAGQLEQTFRSLYARSLDMAVEQDDGKFYYYEGNVNQAKWMGIPTTIDVTGKEQVSASGKRKLARWHKGMKNLDLWIWVAGSSNGKPPVYEVVRMLSGTGDTNGVTC